MNSVNGDVDHGSLCDKPGSNGSTISTGEHDVGRVLARGSGNDWPFPEFKATAVEKPRFSGPHAVQAYRNSLSDDEALRTGSNVESSAIHRSNEFRGIGEGISFHGQPPKRRRGRPPSNAGVLDQSRNLSIGLMTSEASTVQASTSDASETLAHPSIPGDQPVKRRRGRPSKIKPLD